MNHVNFLNPREIVGPNYSMHPGPFAISETYLNKIFPGISKVHPELRKDGDYVHRKGDLDPPNIRFLARLVKYLQPLTMAEVGVFRGRTTYHMALNSPEARIVGIDLPKEMRTGHEEYYSTDKVYFLPENEIGKLFKNTEYEKNIQTVWADSLTPECRKKLDAALDGSMIDFAFIDSSHDYESVKRNFEDLVLPRVAPDGVVLFDDYARLATHPGVTHFLARKAHDDGYVFYWYAPQGDNTQCAFFINNPESVGYRWK